MKLIARALVPSLLLAALAGSAQAAPLQAIDGTASGKVQKVGFRAMILKQAIQDNLAGSAKNTDAGTVLFSLQGKDSRLQDALKRIAQGTAKSADVKIATSAGKPVADLRTFTVVGWTSTSHGISKPYNLVFTLRDDDKKVSKKEAKREFCHILQTTLDPHDWQKAEAGCQGK
ncbi:acylphosphatase [Chromobacterium subtsugae]|uniref:acylphosphatase n=1 Tax=Chromobacterium subtsugae TaxID=251747 RepID=A0ABS7FI83_9NEIS|nr:MULTISPECIES: acylphosphatase [Chromobacterium]KUM05068.1 hypothetical protein Cv017_11155 [Chromobacterium subtsugae]KZE85309.1 hypothetical protein AWB61_20545 [Chromobacterium sp. F49]MBW7569039.1 acylphosphatase [Chromobacterium subtsugae]MBW8289787.1 acylphosphatase [Chromobacterium subtsugae]WSE93692.1 acylphosphatase [Chromobacterium subtsugae]